jgi:hypothetical protein
VPLGREAQERFSAGISRLAPHANPSRSAWDIINGFLDEDGQIRGRGGISYLSSLFAASPLNWLWAGELTPGHRVVFANAADFGVIGVDGVTPVNLGGNGRPHPAQAALVGGILFIGRADAGGYLYGGSRKTAVYATGTVTVTPGSRTVTGVGTAWLANLDAGMLLLRANNQPYVIASVESDTSLTLVEPYGAYGEAGSTGTYGAYPLYDFTLYLALGEVFFETVAGRLVLGQGRVLRFSETVGPTTGQLRPMDIPALNKHEMPTDIRGVKTIRDRVLVFTETETRIVSGLAYDIVDPQGNPQHRNEVASDHVLWGAPGLARHGSVVIAPCLDDVWLMDGFSQPQRLSRSIGPLYRDYVEAGYLPGGATVYEGHYFLPILDSGGLPADLLVCSLERAVDTEVGLVHPWTRMDGLAADAAQYAAHHAETGEPRLYAAGNGRVLDATEMVSPDVTTQDATGTDPQLKLETRHYGLGRFNKNLCRLVRLRYSLESGTVEAQVDADGQGGYVALSGTGAASAVPVRKAWSVDRFMEFVRFYFTLAGPSAGAKISGVEAQWLESRNDS